MDKKIDLDEKVNNVNTDIKLKPNSKSTITLNKRISLDAPIDNKGNGSQNKIKLTQKRKIVTKTQTPSGNEEDDEELEELDDEELDDDEESEDDDSDEENDSEDQNDNSDKQDDRKEEKKENKQETKDETHQQNKKDYRSELKDKAQKKAQKKVQKKAQKKVAKEAAKKGAKEAAKKGAAKAAAHGVGSAVSSGVAAGGTAAAGAGGGATLVGGAYVAFWVIIIAIIILIILFIIAIIITAIGYKYENTASVQLFGTECSRVTITNTDCKQDDKECTNKYDGEVDFETYIAGIIAANDSSVNNKEYFKVSAIRNRTYVQKNISPSCIVEGNSTFIKYIDIDDSSNSELIKSAIEETENLVLVKDTNLADINDTKKAFDRNKAINLITSSNYSYEKVINYFYGDDIQIFENETLLLGNEGLVNPLKNFTCNSYFEKRTHPITNEEEYHTGLDMGGVSEGEPIYAADNGKVTYVEKEITQVGDCDYGYGNYVIIEHEEGISTLYAHMKYGSIKDTIKVGYEVKKGEQIGQVGSTGCSSGAHLHYEVRQNTTPIDPILYMDLTDAQNKGECIK